MSFDDAVRLRLATRYEGEDVSLTMPRELNGWYSYAIAAEVFAVVGVGKPITAIMLPVSKVTDKSTKDRFFP